MITFTSSSICRSNHKLDYTQYVNLSVHANNGPFKRPLLLADHTDVTMDSKVGDDFNSLELSDKCTVILLSHLSFIIHHSSFIIPVVVVVVVVVAR